MHFHLEVRHTPGHATGEDVQSGKVTAFCKQGNDAADACAKLGAAQHADFGAVVAFLKRYAAWVRDVKLVQTYLIAALAQQKVIMTAKGLFTYQQRLRTLNGGKQMEEHGDFWKWAPAGAGEWTYATQEWPREDTSVGRLRGAFIYGETLWSALQV